LFALRSDLSATNIILLKYIVANFYAMCNANKNNNNCFIFLNDQDKQVCWLSRGQKVVLTRLYTSALILWY
jgi:hypothetical protein